MSEYSHKGGGGVCHPSFDITTTPTGSSAKHVEHCSFALTGGKLPCDCIVGGGFKPIHTEAVQQIDGVTKPSHYALFDGIEAIEIIARSMTVEQFRGYCLGNILKYRLRAGKKSELAYAEKDLAKANFYGELFDKYKGYCHAA